MKKKINNVQMKKLLQRYLFIILTPLLLFILDFITLSIIYHFIHTVEMLLALTISGSVLGIASIVLAIVYGMKVDDIYYKGLYQTTDKNYKRIIQAGTEFEPYPHTEIEEIRGLNKDLENIRGTFLNSLIIPAKPDYTFIPLVYLDDDHQFVEHHSFHTYFRQIVYSSDAYRNVLIQMYYELNPEESLTDEEIQEACKTLKNTFQGYPNMLLSPSKAKTGVYCYLPCVDSFSIIKESLAFALKDASLLHRDKEGGVKTLYPRFALVCYPYSSVDQMFSDIDYAKRLGKTISFYLPNHLFLSNIGNGLAHSSVSLNVITKLIFTLSSLSVRLEDSSKSWSTIKDSLRTAIENLAIEHAGVISYRDSDDRFFSMLHVSLEPTSMLEEGHEIETGFVESIADVMDEDRTYYASERLHVHHKLGLYFDKLGFKSCFFYLVKDVRGKTKAVVYFVNQKNDMVLSSYLREALLILSKSIGDYMLTMENQADLMTQMDITSDILKMTDHGIYQINSTNYQLVNISPNLADRLMEAKLGLPCYQVLYGREEPCKDCPLLTSRKKAGEFGGYQSETSMTLIPSYDTKVRTMLMKFLIQKDALHDEPYDHDLLINSYYSLVQNLRNAYLISGKGYLLLLKIDNLSSLVEQYGSETALLALRSFTKAMEEMDKIRNVYSFQPDTIALLLNDYGQVDIINKIESIYEISRPSYFPDKKSIFHLTYLPVSYPQGYANAEDLLRHAIDFYGSGKYETDKDYVYFDDFSYSRPASKREFILSVIDEKFTKKDFTVRLQPVLLASNRKIIGAEMLFRLSDDYRNIVFNTDEIIRIAAENGKISLISDSLLQYIGDLYSKYGFTVFRPYGVNYISINTDYSYLHDPRLLEKIKELMDKYHVPKGFLGLEIREKEIYDHFQEMPVFLKSVGKLEVGLICDQYSGEYLSMEQLVELGFNAFKIDRHNVSKIDVDQTKFAMVRSLAGDAKEYHLQVGLIGVENMNQYRMILDISKDLFLQGYAFYRPLEDQDLISAIRNNNNAFRVLSKKEKGEQTVVPPIDQKEQEKEEEKKEK